MDRGLRRVVGWGFDVFDGLSSIRRPNCVPTLLGLPNGSRGRASATLFWTGVLTSLLLIGWAIGGTIFGKVADRLGRTRTLLLTMVIYSVGTALCAFAPNIWMLAAFRFVASLGIGGEWAAGASMVAEVVPEKRRIEAGALLYTSAPFGLALATLVNYVVAGRLFPDHPEVSWRYVFLSGLIPAAVALRCAPSSRSRSAGVGQDRTPRRSPNCSRHAVRRPRSRPITALTALVLWWICNASPGHCQRPGHVNPPPRASTGRRAALAESWRRTPPLVHIGGRSAPC